MRYQCARGSGHAQRIPTRYCEAGTVNSRIATSDTDLYDHKIQLKLRLRESRLEGAATAVGNVSSSG